jgi:integrase
VPLIRRLRTLPTILSPAEADRLLAALRTHRDTTMVTVMLLGGCVAAPIDATTLSTKLPVS